MNPGYDPRNKRTVGAGPMSIGAPSPAVPMAGPMSIGQSGGQPSAAPPNLREADSEMSCGACQHFSGEACSQFANYPCEATQVCDAVEPAGAGEEEMAGGGGMLPVLGPEA